MSSCCAPTAPEPAVDPAVDQAVAAMLRFVRAFGLVERDAVCCGDVTVAQCVCLQALVPGPQEIADLAELVGTSRPATTRMTDTLERKGWAIRTRDDDDRRRVRVSLTPAGMAQAAQLRGRTEDVVVSLMSQIAEDKRAMVLEALDELARAAHGLRCC